MLSLSCTQRPDSAESTSSTTTGDTSGPGASETGATPVTSGPAPTITTTESSSSTEADPSTSTGLATTTSTDPETDSTTVSHDCDHVIGDESQINPAFDECDPEPCLPGEICVLTLECQLIPVLCTPLYNNDECWIEQSPAHCMQIPPECDRDPEGLQHCLEEDDDVHGYSPCHFGGEYEDGVLDCYYIYDQCQHADGFVYPFCE